MRRASSLFIAMLTAVLATVAATVVAMVTPAVAASGPSAHVDTRGRGVCVDTSLRLTFDQPPTLGTSGVITVHRADGSVADSIDLANPDSDKRTIGDAVSDAGLPHYFTYYPVMITGDTAAIYLHHQLDYGQSYYVTIDPGVFTGWSGIQNPATWRLRTRQAPPPAGRRALTVAADGTGDFCTVQGAIDFIPHGNTKHVLIHVRPGTYNEIDYVSPDRRHVTIRGEDRDHTIVQYPNNNNLNGDSALSPTPTPDNICARQRIPVHDNFNCWRSSFGDEADDFTLENITLRNTTPFGGSQAEAFRGNADRIVLDRVNLESNTDTLRLQGDALVTSSYIEGDVDFVWGVGSVFITRTELRSLHAGFVTQARNDQSHPGYVFVDDRLTRGPDAPDGSVYLGRVDPTVYPYSETLFIHTAMDSHINPAGFRLDNAGCDQAPHVFYAEYGNTDLTGKPIDTSARLACSRQLTSAEAARWSEPAFVLGDWVPRRFR
jgi:pectin methylesterase-like acyl-CoA thioesterase